MSEIPHVALLIETSRSFGRALLRGVKRFMAEHGPWSVYMELRALESPIPPRLPRWRGDGIPPAARPGVLTAPASRVWLEGGGV